MSQRKNTNPLVSVIVPVYNVEWYLRRCLYSICDQNYQNLEILLVDDGSTDASGEICDEFSRKDQRIKVFHQENMGLSGARNRALQEATGEYYAFVDSDDYVAPDFIETMVSTASSTGSEIVQVYVRSGREEPTQNDRLEIPADAVRTGKRITMTGRQMCISLLDVLYTDCGVVWNKLYRARLFRDLRFPVGKLHEDDFLVYKLYWNAGKVTICEDQLYFYQSKRPESIMHARYSLKRLVALEARKEQYQFFDEVGDMELCDKAKAEYVRASIVQIKLLKQSDVPDKKKWVFQLYRDAIPIAAQCLFSRHLSLRKKVGLLSRLLSSLAHT